MIDPLSALAAVKAGISAGKQIHSMSKEIAGFFDSVDGAKKAHNKKKDRIFASANEEAMATWTAAQNAKVAEAELREFITATKGYSAYQELLKLRREIAQERREQERLAELARQEKAEQIVIIAVVLSAVAVFVGLIAWIGKARGVY